MRGRKHGEVPPRLARAAAKLDRWRRTRKRGTRIPEALWAEAVELASTHGLARTANALKLGHHCLKKRLEAKSPRPAASKAIPTFIELTPSSIVAAGECVIELENAAGSRMRVQLKGAQTPDLRALCESFWSEPS